MKAAEARANGLGFEAVAHAVCFIRETAGGYGSDLMSQQLEFAGSAIDLVLAEGKLNLVAIPAAHSMIRYC